MNLMSMYFENDRYWWIARAIAAAAVVVVVENVPSDEMVELVVAVDLQQIVFEMVVLDGEDDPLQNGNVGQ